MPRISRVAPGGMVYHVLNRGVGRQNFFKKPTDYAAFENAVEETLDKVSMRSDGRTMGGRTMGTQHK